MHRRGEVGAGTVIGLAWALALVPACGPAPGAPPLADTLRGPCTSLRAELPVGDDDPCRDDVTRLVDLTPLGHGRLYSWRRLERRFPNGDRVWQVDADGKIAPEPTLVQRFDPMKEHLTALTLLPGAEPQVLATNSGSPTWTLYNVILEASPQQPALASPNAGTWPAVGWKGLDPSPWGHDFLGLENGYVLDRDPADGRLRFWHVDTGPAGTLLPVLRTELATPPRASFTRGHRLAYLGPGRLLEWWPRPCATAPQASAPCAAGADFDVWSYALDPPGSAPASPPAPPSTDGPRDPLAAAPFSSGFWPGIGARHDIVGDGELLFVRARASGELRSYAADRAARDPLGAAPLDTLPASAELRSANWVAPTTSPRIKHLVLILQDGHSFDSYFGRYCRGAAGPGGAPPACDEGAACCEGVTAPIPGAPDGCLPLDADTPGAYHPDATPACVGAKMNGGAMDAYASAPCGDRRDVACAAVGSDAGPVGAYHDLAATGALADRFFQTFAYVDGAPATAPSPDVQNLLYLEATHFTADPRLLIGQPLLTPELGRFDVPWALYAGTTTLGRLVYFGMPESLDPSWYPYRSIEAGELDMDIATGQLPAVSVVVADTDDPTRNEVPGQPLGPGVAFVRGLVDAIAASPSASDTLILLTYLTAGGYYDHVRPPPAPAAVVDAVDGTVPALASIQIPYGPRVPLLALGPFARAGRVSHVPLEISSLAVFIEWNWLASRRLKTGRLPNDARVYRDLDPAINDIGSLLEPGATGEPHVPAHRDD